MKRFLFFVAVCVLTFTWASVQAGIPELINYQGMLTDNSGTPLNGSYDITFKIYNAESAGTKRWEETQSGVSVADGLFNVILGSVNPINLDFSEDYWLEIAVGGETMPDRLKFTSVGYAYRAQKADTATVALSASTGGGWVDAGSTVRLQTSTDNVGIGTSSPNEKLEVNGQNSEAGFRAAWGNTYPSLYGEFTHAGSGGLKINANAGGGWADMSLQTDGTTRVFIESGGNVGIGTTSPGEKLEVNGNLKVTGAYKGNIGSNNGAPFPRPAYDSGWLSINQNQVLTLTHNIGGNVDNYVVDLQFKSVGNGINQFYYGENTQWTGTINQYKGACWEELTSTYVRVHRGLHDTLAPQIRVRIWVYL
jgi:hypothetical protein